VTEELWQYVREPGEGLLAGVVRAPGERAAIDPAAEAALERVIAATQAIRSWREEVGIKPGVPLAARLDADGYEGLEPLLARIARLELASGGGAAAASVPIPGGAAAILDGVDLSAHAERLARERARLCSEVDRLRDKLANAAFVANAPPALVAVQREKLAGLEQELARLPSDAGGQ
jgi:valyl-tRNA synthetase